MHLPNPLIPGRLVRRYKRFLADVEIEPEGDVVTAHVANPGSMHGLSDPGLRVWLSRSDNPKRKLLYSWELAEPPTGGLVGVDAARPNKIVAEALAKGAVAEFSAYGTIRPEARYGDRSRVDFLLSEPDLPDCYLEVKNVHMRRESDIAEFPDSVTARGAKHLAELARRVQAGDRAALMYVVQRDDCRRFALAADYDAAYVAAHHAAAEIGVETLVYVCRFEPPPSAAITLDRALPMVDHGGEGDADANASRTGPE